MNQRRAEDRDIIDSEISADQDANNEFLVMLEAPNNQQTREKWNSITVMDPTAGKEVHKSTICQMINEGLQVGAKLTDRMKRAASQPRYSGGARDITIMPNTFRNPNWPMQTNKITDIPTE